MKKSVIILALIVVAAASSAQASDGKKKKKQQKETPLTEQTATAVSLQSEADSLSYAAGVASTRGLVPFLVNTLKIDTAYMDSFVEGYREAVERQSDPKYKARAAGIQIASQVEAQYLPRTTQEYSSMGVAINPVLMHEGFLAAVAGDSTLMSERQAIDYAQTLTKQRKAAAGEANRKKGEAFLAENKTKPGVVTTESGLQYKVLTEGTGDKPKASDKVKVRYEGHLIDGTEFDSSYKRKPDSNSFKVSSLIKGWVEALQLMPVGSKWELYIPYNLAYGDRSVSSIPPYSALIFTMELLEIEDSAPAKDAAKEKK